MAIIRGSARADSLHGTPENDHIVGLLSDDKLFGYAGNDTLEGGAGRDRLWGNKGDDTLVGGDGNDRLNGDSGDDRLWGGGGHDRLDGGVGVDRLYGDAGDDFFALSSGDKAWGGSGNDALSTDESNVIAYGEAGNDFFASSSYGDITNVTWAGGSGADNYGFALGAEVTITDFEAGEDTVSYNRSDPATGEVIFLEQIIDGFDVSGDGRLSSDDGLSQTIDKDSYTFRTDVDGKPYALDLTLDNVSMHLAGVTEFF